MHFPIVDCRGGEKAIYRVHRCSYIYYALYAVVHIADRHVQILNQKSCAHIFCEEQTTFEGDNLMCTTQPRTATAFSV